MALDDFNCNQFNLCLFQKIIFNNYNKNNEAKYINLDENNIYFKKMILIINLF